MQQPFENVSVRQLERHLAGLGIHCGENAPDHARNNVDPPYINLLSGFDARILTKFTVIVYYSVPEPWRMPNRLAGTHRP